MEVVYKTPDSAGLQVADEQYTANAPELALPEEDRKYPVEYKSYPQEPTVELAAEPKKKPWWKRRNIIIILVVVLVAILVGVVVGGVVGARSSNKASESEGEGQQAGSPTNTAATPSSTANSEPTSNPEATPTSIQPGSMLAAATWLDERNSNNLNYLAYQTPNGTFQLVRDRKSTVGDSREWDAPFLVRPVASPKDISSLALGLVRVQNSVYVDMMFTDDSDALDGAIFDAGPEWKNFDAAMDNDLRKKAHKDSKIAALSGLMVFQETNGELTLRRRTATESGKWATESLAGRGGPKPLPGTHLAIVPVNTIHSKIYVNTEIAIVYQAADGKLALLPYNSTAGVASWPTDIPDIELPLGASFSAISVRRSADTKVELVNTFIVYTDKSNKIKTVWTDNGEEWRESTPGAFENADKGTSISCAAAGTFNLEGQRILAGSSESTKCYFFEKGSVYSAQLNRGEWVLKEKVPLE